MSQDQTSDPTEPTVDDEVPDADVMQAVAEALEATEAGERARITKVESDGEPLLPRRGS